jgi:hypothetical protein
MTFERVCVDEAVFKSGIMHDILTVFTITGTGNMSDCPPDVAQVDFANKLVTIIIFNLIDFQLITKLTDTLEAVFWAMAACRRRSSSPPALN